MLQKAGFTAQVVDIGDGLLSMNGHENAIIYVIDSLSGLKQAENACPTFWPHLNQTIEYATQTPLFEVLIWQTKTNTIDHVLGEQSDLSKNKKFPTILGANTTYTQVIDTLKLLLNRSKGLDFSPKKSVEVCLIGHSEELTVVQAHLNQQKHRFSYEIIPADAFNLYQNKNDVLSTVSSAKLVLILYEQAEQWAISFAKELWKLSGALYAPTRIVLLHINITKRKPAFQFKSPTIELKSCELSELSQQIDELLKIVPTNEGAYCPYTGLRPFKEDDSIFFFGRENHVKTIIEELTEHHFVLVTGASGEGKSSIVYAGVLPVLKAGFYSTSYQNWHVIDWRPERKPFHCLCAAVSTATKGTEPSEVQEHLQLGYRSLVDWITTRLLAQQPKGASKENGVLIIVDQFEEFFSYSENYKDGLLSEGSLLAFNLLIETIEIAKRENLPIYVILTMRSDYIGHCAAFSGLSQLIVKSLYLVPRLNREEVQRIIQYPAHLNGNDIQLSLVQRLIYDIGEGIDQLPVLQHVLQRIWYEADCGRQAMGQLEYVKVGGLVPDPLQDEDRRVYQRWFKTLTPSQQSYYQSPTILNVLNLHADQLYESAHLYYKSKWNQAINIEDAQLIVKSTFLCLTKYDENRPVRNRMTVQDIVERIGRPSIDAQLVGRIVNLFREPDNNFIQPFINDQLGAGVLEPNTVLDITHESLIRNWNRLHVWAEEEHHHFQTFQDLQVHLQRWLDNNRSNHYLLNVGLYNYFESWFNQFRPNVAWINRYNKRSPIFENTKSASQKSKIDSHRNLDLLRLFLDKSRSKHLRVKRWSQFAVTAIVLLLLFSFVLYFDTVEKAKDVRDRNVVLHKQKKEIVDNQRALSANAELKAEKDRLLYEQERLMAKQRLQEEERKRNEALGIAEKAEDLAEKARIEQELAHNKAAIVEKEKLIIENERQLAQAVAVTERVRAQEASEQSEEAKRQKAIAEERRDKALVLESYLLAAKAQNLIRDGATEIALLLSLRALPATLDKPNRPLVAEAEAALYASANAIINEKPFLSLNAHRNKISGLSFNPEGKLMLSSSWDRTVRVWNARTGMLLKDLYHTNVVHSASFSRDSRYILSVTDDYSVSVWDGLNYKLAAQLGSHRALISAADVCIHPYRVATGAKDGSMKLWDLTKNELIANLTGHQGEVKQLCFSPHSKVLVSGGADNLISIWDAHTGKLMHQLPAQGGVRQLRFHPANPDVLISMGGDNMVRFWDTRTGQLNSVLVAQFPVQCFAISTNGQYVVAGHSDGAISIWDLYAKGGLPKVLKVGNSAVAFLQFAPDHKRFVVSLQESVVYLCDADLQLKLASYMLPYSNRPITTINSDGRAIAATDNKYQIHFLRLLPEKQKLIDYVNLNLKKRDLTQLELNSYLINENKK
jgi:hypothetical protein